MNALFSFGEPPFLVDLFQLMETNAGEPAASGAFLLPGGLSGGPRCMGLFRPKGVKTSSFLRLVCGPLNVKKECM